MARKTSQQFIPYELARLVVQQNHIKTRSHYWQWHKEASPKYLPRHPHAHYGEWESWNAFLGNTNSFEEMTKRRRDDKRVWRPYWEAVRYAQQMARQFELTTMDQWLEFHREYEVPRDIPRRPDQVYEEFTGRGWKVWLGKGVTSAVETSKAGVAVLGLHHIVGEPQNIIQPYVHEHGYAAMVQSISNDRGMLGKPYRVYHYEPHLKGEVDRVLALYGKAQPDGSYIVNNLNGLLWDLDNTLLIHTGR